jgi:hypothetical protein
MKTKTVAEVLVEITVKLSKADIQKLKDSGIKFNNKEK